MAYTEREARKLVVEAGRRLLERGLVARTWGNISARVSDTHFIITPSGMAYDTMTEDHLVLVDGRDGSYQGERKPSSERGIHADAYRLRPEVNFVIHTHQDMASVCSTAGRDLTADHPLLGGRVPCAAYGLPSSKALRRAAERVVAGYPDSPAFLLRSHGALCLGRDMEDAFAVSAALEEVCARQIQSVLDTPSLPARIPDYGESVLEGDAFRLMIGERERIFSLGEARLPPAAALHAAIYRAGLGKAVLHVRDRDVIAVSASRRTLRPMVDDLAQIAGADIRWAPPVPGRVARALRGRNAVLLPGAGALCVGPDREETEAVSYLLKKGCLARRFADAVPGCRPLNRMDALFQRAFYVTQYAKRKG